MRSRPSEDATAYSYLVNDRCSAEATGEYTFLNLADPTSSIPWPIAFDSAEVEMSDKDRAHPELSDVVSMPPRKVLVLGPNGQIGRALRNHKEVHGRNDQEFSHGQSAI